MFVRTKSKFGIFTVFYENPFQWSHFNVLAFCSLLTFLYELVERVSLSDLD